MLRLLGSFLGMGRNGVNNWFQVLPLGAGASDYMQWFLSSIRPSSADFLSHSLFQALLYKQCNLQYKIVLCTTIYTACWRLHAAMPPLRAPLSSLDMEAPTRRRAVSSPPLAHSNRHWNHAFGKWRVLKSTTTMRDRANRRLGRHHKSVMQHPLGPPASRVSVLHPRSDLRPHLVRI